MLVFSSSAVLVILVIGGLLAALGGARALKRLITWPFRALYGLWVRHQLTVAAIHEAQARAEAAQQAAANEALRTLWQPPHPSERSNER